MVASPAFVLIVPPFPRILPIWHPRSLDRKCFLKYNEKKEKIVGTFSFFRRLNTIRKNTT